MAMASAEIRTLWDFDFRLISMLISTKVWFQLTSVWLPSDFSLISTDFSLISADFGLKSTLRSWRSGLTSVWDPDAPGFPLQKLEGWAKSTTATINCARRSPPLKPRPRGPRLESLYIQPTNWESANWKSLSLDFWEITYGPLYSTPSNQASAWVKPSEILIIMLCIDHSRRSINQERQ